MCDEKFESLIASSDSIVDPKKYVAAMKETANYVADQSWIIEIFSKNEPGIANAKLTGIAKARTSMEMDYRNIKWAK